MTLRVVELFSGIGAQAQALENLGLGFTSTVCEIEAARAQIERYEAEDMDEGIFEPRFYEVRGMDDDECTFEISEVCE